MKTINFRRTNSSNSNSNSNSNPNTADHGYKIKRNLNINTNMNRMHMNSLSPASSFTNNNNNNNEEKDNNNNDWNIISLIILVTLFLILQSYGFRNISLRISGYYTPHNQINPNTSWCPNAQCTNTPHCKPCNRRFIILVATGRSGSTTLMNLIDLLPNVRMAGENNGQLVNDYNTYRSLNDSIEFELKSKNGAGVEGAWKHFPIPEQGLSCPLQSIYEAINPPNELSTNYKGTYDDSGTILGFKTVRLHQALKSSMTSESTSTLTNSTSTLTNSTTDALSPVTSDSKSNTGSTPKTNAYIVHQNDFKKWKEYLETVFPCAKFIFNIRGDIDAQTSSWYKAFGTHIDGNIIRDYNNKLSSLAAILGPDKARVVDMSEWSKSGSDDGNSGLNVLNDLVYWLGFRNCKYASLIHSNKDGYGKDKTTKLSLGRFCHLPGE